MAAATLINRTPTPKLPRSSERGAEVSVRMPGAPPPFELGRGSAGPEQTRGAGQALPEVAGWA
jgi:hypothetical protein